jgi:hypothetical protein
MVFSKQIGATPGGVKDFRLHDLSPRCYQMNKKLKTVTLKISDSQTAMRSRLLRLNN